MEPASITIAVSLDIIIRISLLLYIHYKNGIIIIVIDRNIVIFNSFIYISLINYNFIDLKHKTLID